jgi:hypothetical protein
LLLAIAAPAFAQDKMDKPVRIIVGFAPGGTADLIARVVGDKLKDTIGQPVIVENRPGAAGRIAADAVKTAAPDGSTIMVMPIGPMAVVPHTLKAIPFDPIKDFTAVGLGATFQFAFAAGPGARRRRGPNSRRGPRRILRKHRTRRRRPAACRISLECCCRATSASTWCTSRTRVPART